MAKTFTLEDVKILGYTKADYEGGVSESYDVIRATLNAGLEEVTSRFIYLKARCTVEALSEAARAWKSEKNKTYVVMAPSLGLTVERVRSTFGDAVLVDTHDNLVWNVLESSFEEYLNRIKSGGVPTEKHFISPNLSGSRNREKDFVNELIDYLSGKSKESDNGTLQVLNAHAGVGKTTLSRYLIHNLVNRIRVLKRIPIYVEAQHWRKLNLTSLDDLWDVIENSLHILGDSPLQLTAATFRHALRQGYFCFIFDGFDELCSGEVSQFEPSSILEELNEIVEKSEARVLITTRTIFWDAKFGTVPDNVTVRHLESFNTQQARRYFVKVFGQNNPQRKDAIELHKLIQDQAIPQQRSGSIRHEFVNLPLFVRMVSDYVKHGGRTFSRNTEDDILRSFLTNICEREITRQGLVTSGPAQMQSFEDMALNFETNNPVFSIEDLAATPGGFKYEDIDSAREHALLINPDERDHDLFSFRYEFIAPYLRATKLFSWIRSGGRSTRDLPSALIVRLNRESDGKGQILEQLVNFLDETKDLHRLIEIGKEFLSSKPSRNTESFFFHAAQSLISNNRGLSKSERAEILFREMAHDYDSSDYVVVVGWSFRGLFNKLDLRGVVFDRCKFSDVIFRDCLAGISTKFVDCQFEGDHQIEINRNGWEEVELDNCIFNFPTDLFWERIKKNKVGDTRHRVLNMLNIGLRKFWHNGTVRRSLRLEDWKRGQLRHAGRAGDDLLEAMLKSELIARITITGVKEGGVAIDPSSIADVGNYMDNNQLSGKVRDVYRLLMSVWN